MFIALEFQEQFSSQFHDMCRKLKATADKSEMQVKWVPTQNLHLTLKFLGEIDTGQIATAAEKLREISHDFSPFELKLRGLGAFPDEREARVIWVGVQNKIRLGELWQKIESIFTPIGFSAAEQDFNPHITIGRLRNKQSVNRLISPFLRKDYGTILINKITLFESHLQGHYPVYKEIERFSLV